MRVRWPIIDRAELAATFIVPTRTLLEQTVRELARQVRGASIGRIGQIFARALRDLRRWYAQAEAAERLLSGPDDRTLAEAADRRAAALAAAQAERARHLDAVFANADHVWERVIKKISRSSHDYAAARILLDELQAAADRHAARAAFELRFAELRAGTAKFRRFWQRWDARHPQAPSPQPRRAPSRSRNPQYWRMTGNR
jgi:hypothetical protein